MSGPSARSEPATIAVDDLPEQTSGPGAPVYLDVREVDEFAAGHVPGAVNVPLGDLPERVSELPDAPIHTLCRTGGRATKAARWLVDHGHDAVVVQGGSIAWAEAGRPLVAEGDQPDGGPFVR